MPFGRAPARIWLERDVVVRATTTATTDCRSLEVGCVGREVGRDRAIGRSRVARAQELD